MRLEGRSRSTSTRNTPSAIGDRQMLPMQTDKTLVLLFSFIVYFEFDVAVCAQRADKRHHASHIRAACGQFRDELSLYGATEHPCSAIRIGVREEILLDVLEPELAAIGKRRWSNLHARTNSSAVINLPLTEYRRWIR
jgi:hypothetical protein